MKKLLSLAVIVGLVISFPTISFSHSGGLDSKGCHNDRKRGGYHCHRSQKSSSLAKTRTAPKNSGNSGGAFRNCSAARAAGAAPVFRGQPGYGRHLDRDNDGIGCE